MANPATPRPAENGDRLAADNARLEAEMAELRAELSRLSATLSDIASHRYEAFRDRAAGVAEDVVRQGAALRDHAYSRAGEMEAEMERSIRERPIAAVAIAAGVGYLVGLISRSR